MAFVSLRLVQDFARGRVRHAQGVFGTTGRNTGRHRRRVRRETGIDALAWRLHTRSVWLVFFLLQHHTAQLPCAVNQFNPIHQVHFLVLASQPCSPSPCISDFGLSILLINTRFTHIFKIFLLFKMISHTFSRTHDRENRRSFESSVSLEFLSTDQRA